MKRVSVEDASKQIGIPVNGIRVMVRRGLLPIGLAFNGGKRTTFYLYQELIDEYLEGMKSGAMNPVKHSSMVNKWDVKEGVI